MIYQLRITAECGEDIIEVINWYNWHKNGLGEEFLLSFEASIYNIIRDPLINKPVNKKIRKALLNRFPYSIYYTIIDNKIIVFTVLHNKRHPATWKKIYKRLD